MTVSTAGCLVAAHLRGLSAPILSDDRLDDHEGAWAPTEQGAARLDLVQAWIARLGGVGCPGSRGTRRSTAWTVRACTAGSRRYKKLCCPCYSSHLRTNVSAHARCTELLIVHYPMHAEHPGGGAADPP